MKVLLVAPHIKIPGTSGAAVHHTEFASALAKAGVEVHILADSEKSFKLNDRVHIHPSTKSNIPSKRFFTSLLSINPAIKICKENNIDLIHDRCDPGQVTGYFVSKILKLPRLAEINENQLSYEAKGNFFRDVITYPLLMMIKKLWIKNIVSDADKIVTVSNVIKSSFTKIGLPKNKMEAIPNGADPEKFGKKYSSARKEYNLQNELVLAVIGELGPRQGIMEIIKAVEKLKNKISDIKLFLVGREKRYENYIRRVKDYVEEKNLMNDVMFTDYIERENIPKFLSTVDIALAPYRESWSRESFGFCPLKTLEYMAAGKIAVTTDTEWNREIIENGKNGFLVSFDNLAGNLEEIIYKITSNKRLRKTIERNARASIKNRFNWNNAAKKYLKIYSELLSHQTSI